eukprot:5680082-Alexandrium_andersonii.AAC.1
MSASLVGSEMCIRDRSTPCTCSAFSPGSGGTAGSSTAAGTSAVHGSGSPGDGSLGGGSAGGCSPSC